MTVGSIFIGYGKKWLYKQLFSSRIKILVHHIIPNLRRLKLIDKPYIGKWISCLYRIGQSFYDQLFAELDIGSGHYACLLCLFRQQGVTQDVISKSLNIDKTTVARAIVKLEKLDYVERHVDATDRRAYKVYLTAKGKALEPKIRQGLKQWSDEITAGFTPAEQQLAYELAERMAHNALKLKERLNRQDK